MNPQQDRSSRCWSQPTRPNTSKLRDHSFLSENTVDRVRKLAGETCRKFHGRFPVDTWLQERIRSCTLDLGSKTCQLGVESI